MFQPLLAWPSGGLSTSLSLSPPWLYVSACFIVLVPLLLDLFPCRILAFSCSSSASASMTFSLSDSGGSGYFPLRLPLRLPQPQRLL